MNKALAAVFWFGAALAFVLMMVGAATAETADGIRIYVEKLGVPGSVMMLCGFLLWASSIGAKRQP
ncbi:hypothetical protein NML43_06520 [Rhodopseudomonas palustris]|uniref:hypothetical protein n=1 Tax=Rhodopseudomonas palustris TaxID=1076 RepID=UPI0020CD0C91|nr:hypothetical protein [Rhodopseudomonas palustris]MCP9626734.1 hypothetical protein [Rhodopseudomonas palustris]